MVISQKFAWTFRFVLEAFFYLYIGILLLSGFDNFDDTRKNIESQLEDSGAFALIGLFLIYGLGFDPAHALIKGKKKAAVTKNMREASRFVD